jgi:hypothetical protein
MSRLGGQNSNLHARIGGMTRSSLLNSDARSLAMRVRGGASGDTGEALTAVFATALAKRRRDSAPAAVKAGAVGRERDVVESILSAYEATPTKSPSESPEKKKPKGRCVDGAGVLMTARRGKALHVEVCAWRGNGAAVTFFCARCAPHTTLRRTSTISTARRAQRTRSARSAAFAIILRRRAKMHLELATTMKTTMVLAEWCGDLDFKAAALHYVKTIYLVLPWGAVQIFAPHRGNAPHRGDPQTLLLSPNLQIPVDALVCVLTSSRDHYEPLVKRP